MLDASSDETAIQFEPERRPHPAQSPERRNSMNRKERRRRKAVVRTREIQIDTITSNCDVQVDAKLEQVVMFFANAKGRKVVEDLWSDVEWTTDDTFAEGHPPDWLFTHIRVTRLPPHLEEQVPLAFASPDALGFAVAIAIHRRHREPERVMFYSGQGADLKVGTFGSVPSYPPGTDDALFAEYVPAGTEIGAPNTSVN
jgi:hypothetical protein